MSDHIPDATKMVCPKCGSPLKDGWDNVFTCGSAQYTEGPLSGVFEERQWCVKLQRDQLRTANAALVERVKRLEEAGDAMLNAWLMPEDALEYSDWVALSSDAKRKWYSAKATR